MKTLSLLTLLGSLLLALPTGNAWAKELNTIIVEQPWARATILKSRPAAAYLTVRNTGAEPDRLLNVTSPVAGSVVIHATTMTDGVMRMSPEHSPLVEPGKSIAFRPGERHLMMTDLKDALRKGETFSLILRFEKAGAIEITVPIYSPGAQGPK